MIEPLNLARMNPAQRAELIYAEARADLAGRLWRAALGDAGDAAGEGGPATDNRLDILLSLLGSSDDGGMPIPPRAIQTPPASVAAPVAPTQRETASSGAIDRAVGASGPPQVAGQLGGLGPNARHQPVLEAAAQRTGLPAAAIAAIVDAEAAKGPDGSWRLLSRNPRSSAAGLGQFLSSTWICEAQRPGTWLNATASERGWLNDSGRVVAGARSELLALRYDAEASINATADYARANLDRLREGGARFGDDLESTARAAYLGHHLGLGDAIKFLKGDLDSSRARTLLAAQVGSAGASRRIAEIGDAAGAHRRWLNDYIDRHIRPTDFRI